MDDDENRVISVREIIDKERADEYLKHNHSNRPLRRSKIKRYGNLMVEGKWALTHQGIAFDTNGRLIDGQNRLTAVSEYNAVVEMMVTRGVDTSTFSKIDTPAIRNPGDTLSLQGYGNARAVAAAVRMLATYDMANSEEIPLTIASARVSATWDNDEVVQWATAFPGIDEETVTAQRVSRALGVRSYAAMTVVLYMGRKQDEEKIKEFAHGIVEGANLDSGDPRLAVRNLKSWGTHTGAGLALYTLQMVGKAWEAYRAGEKVKGLRVGADYVPDLGTAMHARPEGTKRGLRREAAGRIEEDERLPIEA